MFVFLKKVPIEVKQEEKKIKEHVCVDNIHTYGVTIEGGIKIITECRVCHSFISSKIITSEKEILDYYSFSIKNGVLIYWDFSIKLSSIYCISLVDNYNTYWGSYKDLHIESGGKTYIAGNLDKGNTRRLLEILTSKIGG